jgi:hypothetical protein
MQLLLPLFLAASNRPPNAVNVTVISLRAANLTGLTNKDSADYGGDLFFYLGDRLPEPMHCRADPYYPMCASMSIVRHDSVYTRYVLEVDGSFGGCPDGAAPCTRYGACNPDTRDPSGLTWECAPATSAVGKANVTQRYKRPGSAAPWDAWKFELSKFIAPATWYSTQAAGDCDDPAVVAAGHCTWRIVRTLKTVNATCANDNVHAAVRARNATCFGACPDGGADETTDCFINCFFGTLLPGGGAGMALQDIQAPFAAAFEEADPAAKGYCAPL